MMTKKKINRRQFLKRMGIIGGSLAAGGFDLTKHAYAQAKEPIKIGSIVPLTGPFSYDADALLKAATLAVEEWNAKGGVLGRKVELVTRDDQAKPDEAARRTKELIEREKVVLIHGGIGAHTQLAINEQAKLAKMIYVSCSQSNEICKVPDVSPYTFHEATSPYITTTSMGQWIANNMGKKWFYFTADYSFGWQITEGFRNMAKRMGGITEAGEVKHPLGTTDYFTYFPRILAAEPDVLLMNNSGKDCLNAMKQAQSFGLKKKMKIVLPFLTFPTRMGADDETFEGVYGGTTFVWELEEKLASAKKFVTAYRKRWNVLPTEFSGWSYGAMQEMLSGIERAGTLDMKQIILKLEGHEYDQYKGKQWWLPLSHQSIQDFFIVRAKVGKAKKEEGDVFEVVDTVKANNKMERPWQELGFKADQPLSKLL